MTPNAPYAGDTRELLTAWLAGTPIDELRRNFSSAVAAATDLTRFIEEFFGYLLPWGIAGYIRIAAKILSIDEVGLGARFFSSMVMFGVPAPEASWAMAAGVPLRRVAIALADRFLSESDQSSSRGFLEWLGRVETETLQVEYDLSGPLLEDIARALRRAGRNQLLADGRGLEEILPLTVDVRGIVYGNRRLNAHRVRIGEAAQLIREYDNLVDQNAIRVSVNSGELGYLPRDVAQLLAPELDSGEAIIATIIGASDETVPKISLTLAFASSAEVTTGES